MLESTVHYFFFDHSSFDLAPSDTHELWMRLTVTGLIFLFGAIGEFFSNKLLNKETEKWEVYTSMIRANNHILNNFLTKMYLFKLEADDSKDFDKEILSQYTEIINETKAKIKNLEGIDDPQKNNIEERLNKFL